MAHPLDKTGEHRRRPVRCRVGESKPAKSVLPPEASDREQQINDELEAELPPGLDPASSRPPPDRPPGSSRPAPGLGPASAGPQFGIDAGDARAIPGLVEYERHTQAELDAFLDKAADILRGTLTTPSSAATSSPCSSSSGSATSISRSFGT